MRILNVLLFCAILYNCAAQKKTLELNKIQNDVLNAFLNQKYDFKSHFYLNKFIPQVKFNNNLQGNYLKRLKAYRVSDSICKNSSDTLSLKFNCPRAFYLKNYIDVLTEKDFKYLKHFYYKKSIKSYIVDVEFFSDSSLPIIKEHSDNFYESYKIEKNKESINYEELPSLEIKGIYFTQNKEIAVIAHSMKETSMGGGLQYSIMKKENGIWWRYIGSFQLSYV